MAKSNIPPSPMSAAKPWNPDHHEFTRLYHGCLERDAQDILTGGIDLAKSFPDTDFGRGFYTTTPRIQAEDWAYFKHKSTPLNLRGKQDYFPVVLEFRVPRKLGFT